MTLVVLELSERMVIFLSFLLYVLFISYSYGPFTFCRRIALRCLVYIGFLGRFVEKGLLE